MRADSPALSRIRLIALLTGLFGVLLAVAVPLLPVRQDRATLDWPQSSSLEVQAPLVAYVPLAVDISVPCTAFRDLPTGTVLATAPTQADQAAAKGLVAKVIGASTTPGAETGSGTGESGTAGAPGAATNAPGGSGAAGGPGSADTAGAANDSGAASGPVLSVIVRDIPLLHVPVAEIAECSSLTVHSTATATTAELVGARRHDGTPYLTTVTSDARPQMVGVFTDLDRGRLGNAHLHADIDTRFTSSPSAIKLVAIVGAVLLTLIALIALHLLDTTDGRRDRRVLPSRWWRLTWADAVALGTLVLWYLIGANTSDDGYILTMARVSRHAGYMANYYRWFGVAEAPFGWPYEVLAWMARLTDAGPWMRLPALLAGVLCWLVISREVLPRLGCRVRRARDVHDDRQERILGPGQRRPGHPEALRISGVARWTAALVFLAAWLPYDNGLRPEPLIALGALLTWCSVERAIATRRLLPAALAVLIAAFSLAAGPTGLICLAALIAGSRPVLQVLVARALGRPAGAAVSGPAGRAATVAHTAPGTAAPRTTPDTATLDTAAPGTPPDAAPSGTAPDAATLRTTPDTATPRATPDATASRATPDATASHTTPDTAASHTTPDAAASHTTPDATTSRTAVPRTTPDAATSRTAESRAAGSAWLRFAALLAPGIAAGTLVLVVVFADQTLASVLEATRVRKLVGPDVAWFDERTRWDSLLMLSPDGGLARRFGILGMLLCLGVCVLVMLRKNGRIPGTSRGPAVRVLGIVFMSLLLMMFTPTKWTHHFGVYAGLAGSLAALTAMAVGSNSIRAPYHRSLFAAAVCFLLAVTFTGSNGWWYVSSYGVPWWDKPPMIAGKGFSTVFLGLAVLCLLVAAWRYYRQPYVAARPVRRRFDRFAVEPLTIAAAAMVLFEVASFGKAAVTQYPAYSLAESNFRALTGHPCALADEVLVETDTADSLLQPYSGAAKDGLAATPGDNVGFTPDGVADDLTADPDETVAGGANSTSANTKNKTTRTTAAGTGGGTATAAGVNGSTALLPFGLDPARTPVLGSYTTGDKQQAHLTSQWYRLDPAARQDPDRPVLVVTAAGRIKSINKDGVVSYGQDLRVDFGHRNADGSFAPLTSVLPLDIGGAPSWRNLRVPLDRVPANADAVRLVAVANDLTARQWLAVTPPRLPRVATLDDVVGRTDPVLADWHVGLAFPCQRPFDHADGVAEAPRWRILPDRVGSDAANAWQDDIGGGPLGWTGLLSKPATVSTYLNHNWDRDWGELERFTPYRPDAAPAAIDVTVRDRWGLGKDAPIKTR
ncbi:arabinosyltransferase domain-containing protein [Nocardia sp. BMG111209]|uniref:arabinosyltransferase domain-containing protein n=1 Tax=Nocardia sp. BMG111209 TaxID=1160137 RepID=UPI0003AA597F|nr:arabinosyltransferase domain-containing protein [Nocardia sp. BMG111209]